MLQSVKKAACWREPWGRRDGGVVSWLSWESAEGRLEGKRWLGRRKEDKETKRTASGYRTGMLWWCRSQLAQSSYAFDVKAATSLDGCIELVSLKIMEGTITAVC